MAGDVETSAIKYSLMERLRGAFHVVTVGDGTESFSVALTGKKTSYHCDLNIIIKTEHHKARIIIDGSAEINNSNKVFYALCILTLLVLGLFPGTINTRGQGTAVDAMVFMFLGFFVVYDMNKKLAEPEALLERVLNSVATEYGE
jgi:hypothetical protein